MNSLELLDKFFRETSKEERDEILDLGDVSFDGPTVKEYFHNVCSPVEYYPSIPSGYMVELDYIGEGRRGDYNAEDPTDKKLLRYTIYAAGDDLEWEPVDGASGCTQLEAGIYPEDKQLLICNKIHDIFIQALIAYPDRSIKDICEPFSYIYDIDENALLLGID